MNRFNVLTTGILLLCSVSAQALPDDRQQPITIESDSAERNEQSGLTQYLGNVVIRQGSVLIDADRVTITTKTIRSVV
jgi:lipopolysaccharide export system protein LptA